MEIRVEIESEAVREKRIQTGTSDFTVHEQDAWLHIPSERYPQKITLQLADGQVPHKIGEYTIHPSSLTVNKFGSLQLKKVLELRRAA